MLKEIILNAILYNLRTAQFNGITYLNLPTGQTTGTTLAKVGYARQCADRILANIKNERIEPFVASFEEDPERILAIDCRNLHLEEKYRLATTKLEDDIYKRRTYDFTGR